MRGTHGTDVEEERFMQGLVEKRNLKEREHLEDLDGTEVKYKNVSSRNRIGNV